MTRRERTSTGTPLRRNPAPPGAAEAARRYWVIGIDMATFCYNPRRRNGIDTWQRAVATTGPEEAMSLAEKKHNAEHGGDGRVAIHAFDLEAIKAILHDLKPK
jgi:hypothetical protein